jgi:hypothetical protein
MSEEQQTGGPQPISEAQAPPTSPSTESAVETLESVPEANDDDRVYGIYQTLDFDLRSAAAVKEAAKALQELAVDGKLTVLVRIGRTPAKAPRKAVIAFGQIRELDGDYEVIANGAINHYENVRTKKETTVSIG